MIPYTYPLTAYIYQFVERIAALSREEKVCTGTITEAVEFIRLYVGSKEDKFPYTREYSVIQTLAHLEFIKILESDQHRSTFLILDNTFRWADYQKKPRMIKWFLRHIPNFKDFILAISFILSVTLLIIQIIQAIR